MICNLLLNKGRLRSANRLEQRYSIKQAISNQSINQPTRQASKQCLV
ncbi:MAG: hypothetical protein QXT78_05080 [Candidatus Nitrosocaldus sp.]